MEDDICITMCLVCGSENVVFDQTYGYYQCQDCKEVWGYSKDDPDYDEPQLCQDCGRNWIKNGPCGLCGGVGVY